MHRLMREGSRWLPSALPNGPGWYRRLAVKASAMHATKRKGLARKNVLTLGLTGAAGRNRTHDPLVRSQVLYPAELQPLSFEL